MTNSSNIKRTNIITPESAAIFLPVIISTFLSIIIISAFVIPQYIKSNKIFYELKEFIRKKDELPKLKGQYIVINKKLKRLEDEKSQIIELISGKTNLETFVSRLGNIGKKNNIKFISIIPDAIIKFIPPSKDELNNNSLSDINIQIDPLLVDGIKKYAIDVEFISSFNNLFLFLSELEFQENIILLSDIEIQHNDDEQKNDDSLNNNSDLLKTSIKMSIYGRI